ncbi:MAG: hypothetical protein ACFE9L_07690 [Candidatus Hodarchaeota archaeon]
MSSIGDQCGSACSESIESSIEQSCQNITDSCSQQCSEQCEANFESCMEDFCNQMMTQMCGSCCANITCGSQTSVPTIVMPLFGILVIISFITIILGLLQNFNPKGPLYLTLFGSSFLAVSLTGIRFNTGQDSMSKHYPILPNSGITRFKCFEFIHSHHNPLERVKGHEFNIGNKFFCTGCYGILIGAVISIIFALIYAAFGLTSGMFPIVAFITPICFLPILFRYLLVLELKTSLRLLSNILLPIGCSFTFMLIDHLYHNWLLNFWLILLTVSMAFLRRKMSRNLLN